MDMTEEQKKTIIDSGWNITNSDRGAVILTYPAIKDIRLEFHAVNIRELRFRIKNFYYSYDVEKAYIKDINESKATTVDRMRFIMRKHHKMKKAYFELFRVIRSMK